MLSAFLDEAEHKGKTQISNRHWTWIDGSSADKVSLDLKFNPWDTAITCRTEWRALCEIFFAQCDPLEPWNIEQSSVLLDDVKTPVRCMIVVHPNTFEQDAGQPSAYLSIDPSAGGFFTPDVQIDKRVTVSKRQKKTLSTNQTPIDEAGDTMWKLLTNTIPHGRERSCTS